MPGDRPTLYVVDPDEGFADRVRDALARSGTRVVNLQSGIDFLNQYAEEAFQCVFLEMILPGISGLEVQKRLQEEKHSQARVVFCVSEGGCDPEEAALAMKRGADDVLLKPISRRRILDTAFLSLEKARAAEGNKCHAADHVRRVQSLTPRELEIAKLVLSGSSRSRVGSVLALG